MSALKYSIFALLLFSDLQGVFAMSAKRPEVAPSLKINREVPVQLYRGKIIEVEFDHNGAVEWGFLRDLLYLHQADSAG